MNPLIPIVFPANVVLISIAWKRVCARNVILADFGKVCIVRYIIVPLTLPSIKKFLMLNVSNAKEDFLSSQTSV